MARKALMGKLKRSSDLNEASRKVLCPLDVSSQYIPDSDKVENMNNFNNEDVSLLESSKHLSNLPEDSINVREQRCCSCLSGRGNVRRLLHFVLAVILIALFFYESSRNGKGIWGKRPASFAIYICNHLEDDMQQKKITELHNLFEDNLVVITDQSPVEALTNLLYYDRIVFNQEFTHKGLWWGYNGGGHERAMMWMIDNKEKFKHAWVIEEEVYWKSIATLKLFFESYDDDDVDFLHQNLGMEEQPIAMEDDKEWNWWNLMLLRRPHVMTKTAEFRPPYYHGMFMFYRLSNRTTKKLNDWRLSNGGEWTYFEPLLATLPVQDPDLATKSYIDNEIGYEFHLDYSPCYTKNDIYGKSTIYPNGDIFYPVKKGYAACSKT